MKLPIIISVIFFIILGAVANIYFFKLDNMQFIGMMLISLVILAVVANFAGKANRKRKGIKGEPDAFIFPDKTAKKLKKMDLGIQYETSVISTALLLLGIVVFLIYFVFFQDSSWVMKGLVIFNSVCGMGLMFGMLVTYYQQLVSYRESTKFLNDFSKTQQNKSMTIYDEAQQQEDLNPPEELYEDDEAMYENEYGDYDYKNERRNTK